MLQRILVPFFCMLRAEEAAAFVRFPRELSLADCRVTAPAIAKLIGGSVYAYEHSEDHSIVVFDTFNFHPPCGGAVSPYARGHAADPEALEQLLSKSRGRRVLERLDAFLREPADIRHVVRRSQRDVGGSYQRPIPDVLLHIDKPGDRPLAERVAIGDTILFGWGRGQLRASPDYSRDMS